MRDVSLKPRDFFGFRLAPWVRLAAALGLLLLGAAPGLAAPTGYSVFWNEEWNSGVGSRPNAAVWNFDTGGGGWGNGEWEIYVNSAANSHVVADSAANGGQALQIRVERDAAGNFYSARINTGGKATFTYGYVEARLKLPYSQGMWPAFWMLGNNIGSVGWPACGELDIMENIGSNPTVNLSSFHATGWNASASYTNPGGVWFSDTYHTFSMNWVPNCISFYVDDHLFMTRSTNDTGSWPFNLPMFFILNLAVGGTFPGSPTAATITPMNYLVDYVRVYHLTGVPSGRIVSLFAQTNRKFVCAESAGTGNLVANRTAAADWEQFRVIDLGGGNVALQSQANQKYVSAVSAGAGALIASATAVGTWETFHWEPHPDGTVSLKALINGQYVCADQNKGNPPNLWANRAAAGAWESFGVTVY